MKKNIIIIFTLFFICVMALLDFFNVITLLCDTFNLNYDKWSNLLIGIIVELIGGAILLYATNMQIKADKKAWLESDKENKRIEYMPILNFSCQEEKARIIPDYYLNDNYENEKTKLIIVNIKNNNIGFGAIKQCYVNFTYKKIGIDKIEKITNYGPLATNESLRYCIGFNSDKMVNNIILTYYYVDMFDNWYSQKIKLIVNYTGVYSSEGGYIYDISLRVSDPQIIKSAPKKISDFNNLQY